MKIRVFSTKSFSSQLTLQKNNDKKKYVQYAQGCPEKSPPDYNQCGSKHDAHIIPSTTQISGRDNLNGLLLVTTRAVSGSGQTSRVGSGRVGSPDPTRPAKKIDASWPEAYPYHTSKKTKKQNNHQLNYNPQKKKKLHAPLWIQYVTGDWWKTDKISSFQASWKTTRYTMAECYFPCCTWPYCTAAPAMYRMLWHSLRQRFARSPGPPQDCCWCAPWKPSAHRPSTNGTPCLRSAAHVCKQKQAKVVFFFAFIVEFRFVTLYFVSFCFVSIRLLLVAFLTAWNHLPTISFRRTFCH